MNKTNFFVRLVGISLAICCFFGLTVHAQEKPLPSDESVVTGQLPNGFTYFIKYNKMPENRAFLYLGTKVGSILETEEQLGLAHFTEHMAFKGTKNFPKNDLIEYLQRAGVKFGADLNAYTSFEETVYQLPIPSDDPELLTNGIRILRDWAQNVLMETEEIDSERGVIFEEKRQRKGLQQRVQEKTLPILLNGSRYVDRLPIGEERVFMNFDPQVIRNFYRDWYRPDLQAIIAVGDFDVAEMESLIRSLFSDLTMPEHAPDRTEYAVELTGKNHFLEFLDEEITSTTIQIINKYKGSQTRTEEALLRGLSGNIFNSLLNTRLSDLRKQSDPPFVSASVQIGSVFPGVGSANLTVTPKPGEIERGFKTVMTELERVRQHGFTQSELDRAKHSVLQSQAARYRERDKIQSQSLADQYLQSFLNDLPYPDAEFYYHFYNENIDRIGLEDVNAHISKFYHEENRDIFVLAPQKEAGNLPSEDQLLAWVREVSARPTEAYEDVDISGPLVPQLPPAGKVVSSVKNEALGMTTLTLSNGMHIVLKPTDFRNDQILIGGFSKGGTALYGKDDYQSAINAAGIVGQSGLGNFDSKSLPRKLTGKQVQVSPFVNDYFEGINAGSDQEDFETALQLIHLYFTAPRADTDLIEGILKNARENIKNRYQIPGNVFSDTVSQIMNGYHWRKAPPTLEDLDQIDAQRSLEIFRERFADAGDFTFVITGSFDETTIVPLLETYLASLPSKGQAEAIRDIGIQSPKEGLTRMVRKGKEERATVQMIINGDYEYTPESGVYFNALQSVLQYRIMERLRNQESGVYSPGVRVSRGVIPTPTYNVSVSFTTDPDRVDYMVDVTKEELAKLAAEGPTDEEIAKVVAEATRSFEVNSKRNEYWHSSISSYLQLGEDPNEILHAEERFRALNANKLKEVAARYLDVKGTKTFVLLPETE